MPLQLEDADIRMRCIDFAMKIKTHAIQGGMGMSSPAVGFDPSTVVEDATTYYEFVINKKD